MNAQVEPPYEVFMLGDLTDRKDRHSAALTNRVVNELTRLTNLGARFTVLMGNHDKPLNGPPFWDILSEIGRSGDSIPIKFISRPYAWDDLLLLPYSDNPVEDWKDIPFRNYKAIFMHQTVTGATGNNGIKLENTKMPEFPRAMKVYSGDIHIPQVVGPKGRQVQYIGAPHPVSFGDDHICRMVVLDDETYAVASEIILSSIQKRVLRINAPADLADIETHTGDQFRIICKLAPAELDNWPAYQDSIIAWARASEVILLSLEPEIEGPRPERDTKAPELETDPEHILRLFAQAEGIDDAMFQAGLQLLKETAG
jgi:hypothetical protein